MIGLTGNIWQRAKRHTAYSFNIKGGDLVLYPKIREIKTTSIMTDGFKGYNRNLRAADGEFYDTKNLTNDFYPVLSSRNLRGSVSTLMNPSGMAVKDSLVYADGTDLFYNGKKVEGITLSTLDENCPKKFVSMGAYLCIFPDKLYVNTADMTDFGSMEMSWNATDGSTIKYTLCKGDGEVYKTPAVSDTAPTDAKNGDLWIDTSDDIHVLNQYSQQMQLWVEIASTYIKLESNGIGQNVSVGDGLRIRGCAYSGSNEIVKKQLEMINGVRTVKARGDNFIVITGIIDEVFTQNITRDNEVSVSRKVPNMDFVCECQNRLWGCYYGLENGKTVNEIFCSKLGDFKNWEVYAGISTDSYRASCGTEGTWTGAVTYLGHPLFFKENYVHKVYVSANGAHQVVSYEVDGVQKGSENSFAIVNDCLFYKGRKGINIFDGTQSVCISEQLGQERYFEASAGSMGSKYYISMKDINGLWNMFVYDVKKGLWIKEDNTHALFFSSMGDDLYYVDWDTKEIKNIMATKGIMEKQFQWEAVFGVMGYEYSQKKYLSRFRLRMCLEENGWAEVLIQYDSNGKWEKRGVIKGKGINRTFTLPIVPRRCDHLQIKLRGKGTFKLYTFERVLERGSDR